MNFMDVRENVTFDELKNGDVFEVDRNVLENIFQDDELENEPFKIYAIKTSDKTIFDICNDQTVYVKELCTPVIKREVIIRLE